jgi:YVTN family beta-propeller protein
MESSHSSRTRTTPACPFSISNSGQSRGKITVSAEPEGVGINPVNGEVYVTCEEKGEVLVIQPDQQRVLANIGVGGRPRSVAFASDGRRAFIPSESASCLTLVDAINHRVLQKISLREGMLPMGVATSRDGKELYVSTGRANSVAVVDLTKAELVATIPVGKRVWSIALSPDGKKLYTANGATNDVSVVNPAARKELKRVKVGDGPWGIAIVPAR